MTSSMNFSASPLPLWQRLWTYQKERFPLAKYSVLIAAFSLCAIAVPSLPQVGYFTPFRFVHFIATFICVLFTFLQLRLLDEFKDHEDDVRYRPERPVPRGLVTLTELRNLGIATAILQIILVIAINAHLIWYLFLVWGYMLLMTKEFFIADWLKPRLFPYMWSHMIIMPLLALFASGFTWIHWPTLPFASIFPFLLIAFFNGLIIELSRKIWAPEQERPGVDSYSSHWGVQRATRILMGCLITAFALSVGYSQTAHHATLGISLQTATFAFALVTCFSFIKLPTSASAKKMETYSAVWVLISYISIAITHWG